MKMITMMIAIAMMSSMVAYGAMDENPYTQPDGTYISLNGIAVNAQPDGFTLDYGDGLVYRANASKSGRFACTSTCKSKFFH